MLNKMINEQKSTEKQDYRK